MYISRRVDIIGPPVWKSIIAPHLSKSELASLRPWQSEHQQHTLSPLHRHTLTPPRYPTAPSCTRNPSDVEHDSTTPAPPHTLRARLHCHIWTCPSIHVSLCLEEFSPQTSPSGTNYPMVGVLSMCPPHHFSQFPTSGHPCRPAFLPTWPFMACAPPCAPFCTPLRTSVHLHTPLHAFA